MLEEIRRYTDPYSILGITGRKLVRVMCPFKVRVLVDIESLNSGDIVWVERVMITRDLQMIFLVQGRDYYFSIFRILLY